ncbi:phage tail protein [Erythrobacter ani]|uniref:Phage tail protein n=1 Tax=Erythrobacter ani TaxID=2827235 RepID=A0ABS6SMG3_9SPHN|nr:phage tail protein [Erythrobacter ani]MBV7266239.1 hypothetical protein [Erythrobacter ani]
MSAALLPPPARPPHDPLWVRLNGKLGWRLLESGAVGLPPFAEDAASGDLTLPLEPGLARVTGEASGSLGGLIVPGNVALDGNGTLWLLDRERARLRQFDPCACSFRDIACGGVRLFAPSAIAAKGGRIYATDAGSTGIPGTVLVIDSASQIVRATWQPPSSACPNPWQPTAIALFQDNVLVADAANGMIHRFALWGGWISAIEPAGVISRLAADLSGRLYAVIQGRDDVDVWHEGRIVECLADPAEIAERFCCPPFEIARDGSFDLSAWCEGAGWFDPSGEALAEPPDDSISYISAASSISRAIDSSISRCPWHSIKLHLRNGDAGRVVIETHTSEIELREDEITALPDSSWTAIPLTPGASEALILSEPGRYLWLRITLIGGGQGSPSLKQIDIEYPRISLRRYLPAAMGADPVSADFLDRFLGVFDRGIRGMETTVDAQAEWFDPRTTPANSSSDMLSWLASWIGVSLDRRWPEARRRHFVRSAAKLFGCRGTEPGLRGALLLWLGWDTLGEKPQSVPHCAPVCAEPPITPAMPRLVLEHWKLRRWLFLGGSRLGGAARIWGAALLGRSQLGENAQTGVTRLDASRDPLRDPFHESAHQLSVFLPAHSVDRADKRASFRRLLGEQIPAHVEPKIVAVEPRMRIGIQAALGFDSVVGCWPPSLRGSSTALGEMQLGRASLLPGTGPSSATPPRLGTTSRLRRLSTKPAPPERITP